MKQSAIISNLPGNLRKSGGFALVATLVLMVLLSVLVLGMLSLSAVTLRSASHGDRMFEARANARLALMMALGELQKEMGPDMRVSAESAILDSDEETDVMDGVEQSRWLASYDSWGNWLNADYTPPDGDGALTIQDTYDKGRSKMFRRWLLSLPEGTEGNIDAPKSLAALDPDKLVVMVGEGSIGIDTENPQPGDELDQVTKAYLVDVGENGRHAWWIGPENHRAKVTLSDQPRELAASEWESSQGETAEVGVGVLDGFGFLETGIGSSKKLVSYQTLEAAGATEEAMQRHFFDLTSRGKGVMASVRTGRLKKDLSLLLEKDSAELPDEYRYESGDTQEPSIRPMSPDLLAKEPKITERHFASWTNMRHFYRMYRQESDAESGSIDTSGALVWTGDKPWTEGQVPLLYRDQSNTNQWWGDNSYYRMPVLAKLTFIYSLKAQYVSGEGENKRYRLYLVYTPVYTYWNPYNTELRIPDNTLGCLSSTYQVLPMGFQLFLENSPATTESSSLFTSNAHSFLRSGDGSDIVFKPGEIRLFSHDEIAPQGNQYDPENLMPGFNPMAYGGDIKQLWHGGNPYGRLYQENQNPGIRVEFSHSVWGGNVGYGNTAGSLCHTPFWLPQGQPRDRAFNWNFPMMCQNDWFNLSQTYTPMTNTSSSGIRRWVFQDEEPVPVAYAQLVLKGLSEYDYESIGWAEDWRSRNWIQSPPFYFGHSLYMSEDEDIAHTQRLNNPYMMNFGPMSSSEMPKVVGHIGERAFLGSGSSPFEKVTAVAPMELPTAPVSGLAGFSGMRINPGWANPLAMNSDLKIDSTGGHVRPERSFYYALNKTISYQSGVTGPGIGNSFLHPMIPSDDVYRYFNNSVSADPAHRGYPLDGISYNDNKVFCDFWDHAFLLNDALWDDYFVSSLADQTRPGASSAVSLGENLDRLVAGEELSNSRFTYYDGDQTGQEIRTELEGEEGYLKAAGHLMVDGIFNVNSTSVAAWQALFTGIRERKLVYRTESGAPEEIGIPAGKTIALSRLNTAIANQEMDDPENGVELANGNYAWTGVRFLDDEQLRKLAEECVKQVKLRGPFLNYSEFVNRRLSDDGLGVMGALQAAIDYDDGAPQEGSINYRFKNGPDFMVTESDYEPDDPNLEVLFETPEAAEGSRFAGIPGYVIQSDLLKPLGNTLSVRDDTFRIRAYGESLDGNGKVVARAWCEAVVQRIPDFYDGSDGSEEGVRILATDGSFVDADELSGENLRFGRRFRIESFRWLNENEV